MLTKLGLLTFVTSLILTPVAAFAHEGHRGQIAELDAALAAHPDSVRLLLRRGELHRLEADFAMARTDFANAEVLDPGRTATALCMLELQIETGELDLAARGLAVLRSKHPENAAVWTLQSAFSHATGNWASEVEALGKAIDVAANPRPDSYAVLAKRILAVAAEDDGDAKLRAIHTLDAGTRRLGNVPVLHLLAIDLELELGEFQNALTRLDLIAPFFGEPALVTGRRAAILSAAGRPLEAAAAHTETLERIETIPRERRSAELVLFEEAARTALAAPPTDESPFQSGVKHEAH